MITITVLGLLLGLGVPSFINVTRNNRLATQANELVTALSLARSEANKRGLPVSVCASSSGAECDGEWTDGWIVFVDTPSPNIGVVDGPDEVLSISPRLFDGFSLSETNPNVDVAVTGFVVFLPSGLMGGADPEPRRLQLVWAAAPDGLQRCITVTPGGRASVAREAC
jgi:type IV fimbrial biogenesis protein FimT